MSTWNPPRLLDKAVMSLLSDEALAISALEYLPIEFSPPTLHGSLLWELQRDTEGHGASLALCPPASGGTDGDASPGNLTSSAGWT